MSQKPSGPFKLDLEVGGLPVRLGDAIDSNEWRKACANGVFSRVGLVGKLMMGAGFSSDEVFSARNQDLQLFGGKVFVGPDLGDGPMKFGTSASAFFRSGSLHRLRAGVSEQEGCVALREAVFACADPLARRTEPARERRDARMVGQHRPPDPGPHRLGRPPGARVDGRPVVRS